MNYLKNFLYLLVIFLAISIKSVFAASIDHFKLTMSPEEARIGDAFDITIEAMDKNDNIVKDYEGKILILSSTDTEAEFPSTIKDNSYDFKKSDEGKVKFENAIKFKKSGTQKVEVYDFGSEDVMGSTEVNITKESVEKKTEIEILTPEDGLTIGENKLKLSGKTKKNYKVKVFLNGKEIESLNSNDDGYFEKQFTELANGENSFSAQILDADDKIIGESKTVKVKVSANTPKIKSVKITPNKDVEIETKLNAELISVAGLEEVSLVINDVVFKLEEKGEGVYRGTVVSPKEGGDFRVDAILKDDLGHITKELGVETINVKEIELKAGAPEEILIGGSPGEKELLKKEKDLKITGLKLIELKTKSILTWDKLKDAYKYNVYKKLPDGKLELIKTVDEPKIEIDINLKEKDITYDYFAVKALAKSDTGSTTYEGDLSEATKIQTGPELYILLFLSMIIGGFAIYKKKYYRN